MVPRMKSKGFFRLEAFSSFTYSFIQLILTICLTQSGRSAPFLRKLRSHSLLDRAGNQAQMLYTQDTPSAVLSHSPT